MLLRNTKPASADKTQNKQTAGGSCQAGGPGWILTELHSLEHSDLLHKQDYCWCLGLTLSETQNQTRLLQDEIIK